MVSYVPRKQKLYMHEVQLLFIGSLSPYYQVGHTNNSYFFSIIILNRTKFLRPSSELGQDIRNEQY